MASVKTSKVNPKYKRKYRVRNWAAYERGLRDRGDVMVWLSQEAIEAWTPPPTGRRGGQLRYSSLAIITALTLRVVFRLPLRQTEGFLASLLRLLELDLDAPDHTTLSRRNQTVDVPALRRVHAGPMHLIVDSSGPRIFGVGQWNSRKHRKAKDRSGWRRSMVKSDASLVTAHTTGSRCTTKLAPPASKTSRSSSLLDGRLRCREMRQGPGPNGISTSSESLRSGGRPGKRRCDTGSTPGSKAHSVATNGRSVIICGREGSRHRRGRRRSDVLC